MKTLKIMQIVGAVAMGFGVAGMFALDANAAPHLLFGGLLLYGVGRMGAWLKSKEA